MADSLLLPHLLHVNDGRAVHPRVRIVSSFVTEYPSVQTLLSTDPVSNSENTDVRAE
jgi:hypothetical protein